MVRWFKLFDHQYFGFWALGVVCFAVQEIPYMMMPFLHLETNPIMNMVERSAALDVCEKVLGSLCIALMIFVVHEDAVMFSISEPRERAYFEMALRFLFVNFFGWALDFTGHQSVFIMMLFLVAMPPLYYVAIGLWRKNVLLVGAGAVFLVVHFAHVYGNLMG